MALIFIAWFQLDELSHKGSGSSLNASQPSVTPRSLENLQSTTSKSGWTQDRPLDEWEQKLCGKQGKGEDIWLFSENSEAGVSLEGIAGACSTG
jgi:hypothetical protein